MDLSSPKLHLPILNGYLLGEAMSCHDGVRCYPAIKRGTDEKYILKIISFPDCPDRLDALLLTGAVADKKAALAYFMDLAKETLGQTDILRKLSHQEGFVPYLDGQIDAMDSGTGYEVYLLGTYKRSLERMLRTEAMTHADVIHMGLDLCAALAACRRAGYLYADLKPGNIFFDAEQGFRIGDVGFISLQSMKYASLPDKYRSSYTAPELSDMFATLNKTVDIYALGLVLYQAYNGGILPFEGAAPAEELPTPLYADYEMANIILKACHPDPKQRWREPTQMAQALIGYMQEFGASEEPIIPPVMSVQEPEEAEEEVEEFLPEADAEQLQREMDDLVNAEPEELAFLAGLVSDETAPSDENAAEVSDDVITEEISQMLAQADELIAHQLPEPPVAPEPIDVPMPEPIVLEPEEEETTDTEEASAEEEVSEPEVAQTEEVAQQPETPAQEVEAPTEEAPAPAENPSEQDAPTNPRPRRFPWRLVTAAAVIVLLLGLLGLGKHYYDNDYLLHVEDLILSGANDKLTVQVLSDIEDGRIRVVCTDIYGNSTQSDVVGGVATFTDLKPSTRYTIRVEAVGMNKLTGSFTDSYTTAAQTQIHSFTAGIGPEDCSVVLNFTHSGTEAKNWTVTYSAEGITPKSQDFSDRSVVIYDLQPGAVYTFVLSSADGLFINGQTEVSYLVTNILFARDLAVLACGGGQLQVQWQQPDNGQVSQWQVRCYNANGYSKTITTDQTGYTFTDLDLSIGYAVEVTAVGMNRSVSTSVSANPITVSDISCRMTEELALEITWNFAGQEAVNGWILRYSIDGNTEKTLTLLENKASILAVCNGVYQFTLEAADGSTVLGGSYEYAINEMEFFANHGVTAKEITISTFLVPEEWDWSIAAIPEENFRPLFLIGEQAALLITLPSGLEKVDAVVSISFVLHNADGTYLRTEQLLMSWNLLWIDGPCAIILPYMPEEPGNYILSLYIDGDFLWKTDFVIG